MVVVDRPVAVPDDVDRSPKRTGVVVLPHHIAWSGRDRPYDLSDHRDAVSLYEQVLREGTDDDVCALIDVDRLLELWNELVLPTPVRLAWAVWFRERRGVELAC